ncbi:MAG: RNA methyltransferase [Bacteroidales bacterium]|nr:RNA methyltransferase [Bacteroidales bacterium]
MAELLTSTSNPKLKRLLALREKSRMRREEGVFVVEGRRELERCVAAGFELESLFVCPEIADCCGAAPEGRATRGSRNVFELSKDLYAKAACREGTEGVLAIVRSRELKLQDMEVGKSPLIMVLESVEKPGNLGAVLRSADAAGADAVIVCDPLTDLWNPNLIRASVGAVFTVPVVCCSSEEAIAWLKDKDIRILTAQLQDSSLYYDRDMTGPTAIVMGTEATGLTDAWRKAADAHIRIPMLGVGDSLNVSVSAAILLYEAVRQRHLR